MNFTRARMNMVDSQIQTAGVTGEAILNAFGSTPREFFVPANLQEIAYCEDALSLGQGRYLFAPPLHARMIQAAAPQPSDIVLDIGCATGYSAAILSPLVTTVVALESDGKALAKANKLWAKLDVCNVAGLEGDLTQGAPEHAPYSLIVINGAVTEVPQKISDQLGAEGRLVAVVRKPGEMTGRAVLMRKSKGGACSAFTLFEACAHYLPGFESGEEFHF